MYFHKQRLTDMAQHKGHATPLFYAYINVHMYMYTYLYVSAHVPMTNEINIEQA